MRTNLNGEKVKIAQTKNPKNVRYFRDHCGATASITKHKDGSATLRAVAGTTKFIKKYKSYDSAYQAWWGMCN